MRLLLMIMVAAGELMPWAPMNPHGECTCIHACTLFPIFLKYEIRPVTLSQVKKLWISSFLPHWGENVPFLLFFTPRGIKCKIYNITVMNSLFAFFIET
jgi:hypothetical protein